MPDYTIPEILDPQLKLATLLAHAALGRRLLPTAWIVGGRCSCSAHLPDESVICSRGNKAGKHPLIGQWQLRASCEPDEILAWHNWRPLANWGWLQDKTFALDVDPKRGGLESLAQWEAETGGPNATLTQRTQSGGFHFIYTQPHGGMRTEGDMLPGIEIRALGAYIMVDPSVGLDGAWSLVNPSTLPAEPEEIILQLIEKHGLNFSLGDGDGVERRGGRARKKRADDAGPKLPATEYFLKSGFGGHTGSRNKDAYALAWRLLSHGDRWPELWTNVQIARTMKRCWDMTDQGDAPFTWDECLGALKSAYARRERQKKEDESKLVAMARSLVGGA